MPAATPQPTIRLCSVTEALDYYNVDIIDRFLSAYDMSVDEAECIFSETKKWIWLLANATRDRAAGRDVPRLVIDNYILFIDEMWHNFILFTREYDKYCRSKFGFFIHHNPTPPRKKQIIMESFEVPGGREKTIAERRRQYRYIAETLGADSLHLWYGVLCEKYTRRYLESIRK